MFGLYKDCFVTSKKYLLLNLARLCNLCYFILHLNNQWVRSMPIKNNFAECDIHEVIKFHVAVCLLVNLGLISIRGMIEMFEDAGRCNNSVNISNRFHSNLTLIGTPLFLLMNLAYVFMQQNADNEEGVSISNLCRLVRDFLIPTVSIATVPTTLFAYNAYKNCRSVTATPDSGLSSNSSCWTYDANRDLPNGQEDESHSRDSARQDEELGNMRDPSPFVLEPPMSG